MTKRDVFDKTQDISDDFVGVFLGGDIRAGWTPYGWQAYIVKFKHSLKKQEFIVESVKVLRIKKGPKKGQPVRTVFGWESIGELIERIEKLNKAGLL